CTTTARVSMNGHLLDAVGAGTTRRIVYVADASCYGATGARAITEDAPLRPSAWGRCFTPALDRVDGYGTAGLPIVTAFAGWGYGGGRVADRDGVARMGVRRRFLVLRTHDQAGDHQASCSPVWKDRSVGLTDPRPRLRPRPRASCAACRTGRPVFPGQRESADARVRRNLRAPCEPSAADM